MKTVLVVDDEPLIRHKVKMALNDYGFDFIYEAEDGSQAIDIAAEKKPLLTVMDVNMPTVDGIEAAESINRTPCGAIVLLTGAADAETVARAKDAGVDYYLLKPFKDDQLKITVDLAINHFIKVSNLHDEVEKLKDALETRKLVDKAKAALIKSGMSEPHAHRKIQKLAMDKRKSLKEVAEAILLMEG